MSKNDRKVFDTHKARLLEALGTRFKTKEGKTIDEKPNVNDWKKSRFKFESDSDFGTTRVTKYFSEEIGVRRTVVIYRKRTGRGRQKPTETYEFIDDKHPRKMRRKQFVKEMKRRAAISQDVGAACSSCGVVFGDDKERNGESLEEGVCETCFRDNNEIACARCGDFFNGSVQAEEGYVNEDGESGECNDCFSRAQGGVY